MTDHERIAIEEAAEQAYNRKRLREAFFRSSSQPLPEWEDCDDSVRKLYIEDFAADLTTYLASMARQGMAMQGVTGVTEDYTACVYYDDGAGIESVGAPVTILRRG